MPHTPWMGAGGEAATHLLAPPALVPEWLALARPVRVSATKCPSLSYLGWGWNLERLPALVFISSGPHPGAGFPQDVGCPGPGGSCALGGLSPGNGSSEAASSLTKTYQSAPWICCSVPTGALNSPEVSWQLLLVLVLSKQPLASPLKPCET